MPQSNVYWVDFVLCIYATKHPCHSVVNFYAHILILSVHVYFMPQIPLEFHKSRTNAPNIYSAVVVRS